jgi:hypothetical protein
MVISQGARYFFSLFFATRFGMKGTVPDETLVACGVRAKTFCGYVAYALTFGHGRGSAWTTRACDGRHGVRAFRHGDHRSVAARRARRPCSGISARARSDRKLLDEPLARCYICKPTDLLSRGACFDDCSRLPNHPDHEARARCIRDPARERPLALTLATRTDNYSSRGACSGSFHFGAHDVRSS